MSVIVIGILFLTFVLIIVVLAWKRGGASSRDELEASAIPRLRRFATFPAEMSGRQQGKRQGMWEHLRFRSGDDIDTRRHRNFAMAMWLVVAACLLLGVGLAVIRWTPTVVAMAPVFVIGAGVYAIMGRWTRQ